jgi:parallel beta-helix repeat protein
MKRAIILIIFLFSISSFAMAQDQASLQATWNKNLGLYYVPISKTLAADLNTKENYFLISAVFKDSAAEAAGLIKGDIIISVDKKLWNNPQEKGEISILRSGQKINLQLSTRKHAFEEVELVVSAVPLTNPRTIVVDQTGEGDFQTITAALVNAAYGDTILIRNGLYREGVVLVNGVTLRPQEAGGVVRLESAASLWLVGCQNVTLEGIDIAGKYLSIDILNAQKISVRNCNIFTDENTGIFIDNSSEVSLEGLSLSGSAKEKIRGIAIGNSQAKVSRCTISDYETAIIAEKSSRLEADDNLLDGNKSGLAVFDSQLNAKNNSLTGKGEKDGIYLRNAKTTLTGNFIRRFSIGVEAIEGSAELLKNTFSQNKVGVILYSGVSSISENVFLNNQYFGIFLNGAQAGEKVLKQATITRNTVTANGASGINMKKFKADILYNLIEANRSNGIIIEESEANISNNTVVLNKLTGIEINRNSQAGIYNNIVAFNVFGIGIDVSAQVKKGYNDVYWNLVSKKFPLVDGNYVRYDRLTSKTGEKIHISVSPAYDLKESTDFNDDPKFVKLGSDYSLSADSALAKKKGKDNAPIGAFTSAP